MLPADGEDEDKINEHFTGVPANHDYPYGNKTMCYLDILDNLPRLRLSSSQLKMILWIMQQCGAKDVPSFNAFHAMQKHIRGMTGVRSEPHKSDLGNLFYVNDIRDLVAKDFANPEVAPHIQKYPEDVAGGPISEYWQVKDGKWHNIPLDALTPSILVNLHRYYIHEVAQLADGRWVIPALWIVSKGKTYADCRLVERNEHHEITRVSRDITRIPLDELSSNQEAIERRISIKFHRTCQDYARHIPNRFRAIDNGEDLFTVWVPIWADDVSGARSKQYQKHLNVYTANANLPGQLLQQEYFVRFVSTSPHAGALEQLKYKFFRSTHTTPIRTYDAESKRPCGVRLNVPDGPADNPQQAEEASHIGHQGNYFCRRCNVGGSNEQKESPDGYHSFYAPGQPRNVEDIRSCVLSQIRLAAYGVAARVEELQTATEGSQADAPGRSVDVIANELLVWLSEQTDQPYNPLLDLPFFDPSQDTLVEILHTILLGDAKYTWYELHHNWTAVQQDIFTVRLQSTNLDGLRLPPIRAAYMMQYRNGLIGKHFKSLMQTMIFHVHDIVSPDQFTLIRALRELGPLLWLPVIDNMDNYLADLQILIDNLLDAFATIDPSKILIKLKLHVLLHIVSDIRRRGPGVRFSTEAPSRDMAAKFADLDRVKHILSGGYWSKDAAWYVLERMFSGSFARPRSSRSISKKQSKPTALTTDETMLNNALNPCSVPITPGVSWTKGENVSAVSGDRCTVGSWALPIIAQVLIILLPKGSKSAQGVLVVDKHDVGEALHPQFHMPVLLPDAGARRVVVPSNSIQSSFNAQHDCRACGCDASGITRQMQERQESNTIIHSIVHKDDTRFVINMHGFHNAGLLRKYLPVALTKPRPLYPEGERAATQAKAAATREKNKAAKGVTSGALGAEDIDTATGGGVGDDSQSHKRARLEIT
ncbi:hypothetical protein DFH07DRAFT_966662 [Mycena maculata]|uniref:Uncharacterized protein n=1 Tax=Mycena maculata TaxID=230809 RepID=A0AAD7I7S4_9AGAR|nr:hypothetical protein DFH07DRAFT_966662 [Mycena maculata]